MQNKLTFKFHDAFAQVAFFGKLDGFIANNGHDGADGTVGLVEHGHGESDRQCVPIFMHRRYAQNVVAVLGYASFHGFVVAVPVLLLLALGDDQIQGFAQSLGLCEAKHALASGIPQDDEALGVCGHDAITDGRYKGLEIDG